MEDAAELVAQFERAIGTPLSPEQRAQIPSLLAVLVQLGSGRRDPGDLHGQLSAEPQLTPLLQRLDSAAPATAGINFGSAQTGDVSFRDVANAIIHNTIILSTDPAHAAARFADGISALQLIIQRTPAARDTLVIFRDRLAEARLQVRALINLKTLHDLLHAVQYRTLPMIVRELRHFPDDEQAAQSIEQGEIDLRDLHGQIESLVVQEYFQEPEVAWRVTLLRITFEINTGRMGRDRQRIDGALRLAKSVINTRLSSINTNLFQLARALRVEDLALLLRSLVERLVDLESDKQELARVEAGIAGLVELHQLLSALVFVHNGWQELDDELNRIEPSLRMDRSDLALSWPYLRSRVELLCQGAESWAVEIRASVERLGEALVEPGDLPSRAAFDRLQNRISHRFFTIDLNLKSLCDRLRDFRDPLDSLGVGA